MNYHPLFVHFPIAFWTMYCLAEFIRAKKVTGLSYWFYIKGVMVTIGTIMAIPTFLSGKIIAGLFPESLVEVHFRFVLLTIIVFSLITLSYLITWVEKDFYSKVKSIDCWLKISVLNTNIFRPRMKIIMAAIGFLLITITGALGGIIAFGPDTDPLTQLIYVLFFGK